MGRGAYHTYTHTYSWYYPKMLNQQARWGHLTRLKVEEKPVMLPLLGGGEYDCGDRREIWFFRCDCGYEWEIDRAEFPGRFTIRNCGDLFEQRRTICPFARAKSQGPPAGRPRLPGGRGIAVNIYMAAEVYRALEDLANEEKTSLSKIASEILRAELVDKPAKVPTLDSKLEVPAETPEEDLEPVLSDEPPDW